MSMHHYYSILALEVKFIGNSLVEKQEKEGWGIGREKAAP